MKMDNLYYNEGRGKLGYYTTEDKFEIHVSEFRLIYFVSGRLNLYLTLEKQKIDGDTRHFNKIIFEGITNDGFTLSLDVTNDFKNGVVPSWITPNRTEMDIFDPLKLSKTNNYETFNLKFYLTNFQFDYNVVDIPNGKKYRGFVIKVDNKSYEFYNVTDYKEILERIRYSQLPIITSYSEIKNSGKREYETDKKTLDNLCELFSYTQRQFIDYVYEEKVKDGEVFEIVIYPKLLKPPNYHNGLIEASICYTDGRDLQGFINKVYGNYIKYKEQLKLNYALTYYISSFQTKLVETNFMLVFTAVESICRTYEDSFLEEHNWKVSEIKQDQYKDKLNKLSNKISRLKLTSTQIDILSDPNNTIFYYNLSFQESLNILSNGKLNKNYNDDNCGFSIPLNSKDRNVHRVRNRLMHKGSFEDYSNMDRIGEYLESVVFLFDRVFLSILGYSGWFRDYRNVEKWVSLDELRS